MDHDINQFDEYDNYNHARYIGQEVPIPFTEVKGTYPGFPYWWKNHYYAATCLLTEAKLSEVPPDETQLLSCNPCLTPEYMLRKEKEGKFTCDWELASVNVNMTMKFVKDHPELKFDFSRLSLCPSLKAEDILENRNFHWNYISISCNHFEKHPVYKWKLENEGIILK